MQIYQLVVPTLSSVRYALSIRCVHPFNLLLSLMDLQLLQQRPDADPRPKTICPYFEKSPNDKLAHERFNNSTLPTTNSPKLLKIRPRPPYMFN